jgi:hypothetical protein
LVRRSQYSLAGTFHRRRSHLLETWFLQAGKGALKIQRKKSMAIADLPKGLPEFSGFASSLRTSYQILKGA